MLIVHPRVVGFLLNSALFSIILVMWLGQLMAIATNVAKLSTMVTFWSTFLGSPILSYHSPPAPSISVIPVLQFAFLVQQPLNHHFHFGHLSICFQVLSLAYYMILANWLTERPLCLPLTRSPTTDSPSKISVMALMWSCTQSPYCSRSEFSFHCNSNLFTQVFLWNLSPNFFFRLQWDRPGLQSSTYNNDGSTDNAIVANARSFRARNLCIFHHLL